jgi:hypothetical protein
MLTNSNQITMCKGLISSLVHVSQRRGDDLWYVEIPDFGYINSIGFVEIF